MRRIAEQFHNIASKVNSLKQLENDKLSIEKLEKAREEAFPALEQIFQEMDREAKQGNYSVRIPAVRVGINELSEIAFQAVLQELRLGNFKVKVNRETFCDALGLDLPGNHDIEGWEKYREELDKRTKNFIQDIVVSW